MMILPHGRRFIWSLRAQVFIAGAVVMALELVGSRILASDFGNSIFVWGSLIGVVLTALSLGYSYGGRLADRILSHGTFSSIIFSAGLFTLFIPYLSPVVIDLALRLGLGERYGPLLVTTLLMGLPTFLLGMVSPYAIKLATSSLSSLGKVAGSLYSLSTLGSIAGTFTTVFILIPSMDVRAIISWLGIALLAVSLICLGWGPRILFVLVVILVLSPLSALLLGAYVHSGNVLYEKETSYSHLDVVDSNGIRTLYLNCMPHSAMYLDGSSNLVFTYTRYFSLGFMFNEDIRDVLFVGGGGFSGPKKFLQDYPDVKVDVVEIDPDVIQVAERFFNVKDDPRLTVYNEDGRNYLSRATEKYDLIILDAYSKTYVPFHLLTHEFFETIYGRLNERGVVVSNLIASLVGDTSDLFWAEYKTVAQTFPSLYVFPTSDYGAGWVQNVILVASKNPQMLSKEALIEQTQKSQRVNPSEMLGFLSHLWNGQIRVEHVPILSDNFAPVEMLLNPVTGKPYALESEHQLERPAIVVWSENSSIVVTALAAVTIIWLFFGISSSSFHSRPNIRLPVVRSAIPYILICIIISFCLISFQQYFLSVIPIAAVAFLCWFFRDPERNPPEGDHSILAPCDGRVLGVSRYNETDFLEGTFCKTISIFMSPLDVHVNRSPVSGQIIRVSRIRGSFVPAFRKKASESNARNIIGIDANGLNLFVVQVAGFFARRIECRVKVGDFVERGQRIGMIRFGSRVDVILPEIQGIRILVEKGAKVRAGETIVAKWIH